MAADSEGGVPLGSIAVLLYDLDDANVRLLLDDVSLRRAPSGG